jgi:Protein of unknown function (DUF2510)/Domain of unknown function (DUF4328)
VGPTYADEMLPPSPSPSQTPPPGWYTDPWGQGPLRWWDGTTWSSHTSGSPSGQLPTNGPAAVEKALVAERKAVLWLGRVCLVAPVLTFFSYLLMRSGFRTLVDDIKNSSLTSSQRSNFGTLGPAASFGQLLGLGSLALLGCEIWWGVVATTTARALGLSTRREAGLAGASFIIPFVNLVWPYQTAVDVFSNKSMAKAGTWWTMRLGGNLLATILFFVSIFVTGPTGIVLLLVSAGLLATGMYFERSLIARALAEHERMAADRMG